MRHLLLLSLLICSPALADETRIQVLIKDNVNGQEFNDAIYYSDLASYTEAKINGSFDSERKKRVDNYKSILDNSLQPKMPTKQDLMDEKSKLLMQVENLDEQISEKT